VSEQKLTRLAEEQDNLWLADSQLFSESKLPIPLAHLIWEHKGAVDRDTMTLGGDPAEWMQEVVSGAASLGGDIDAVILVGLGAMKAFEETDEDAQNLMSLSAGLSVTDLPDVKTHLVSHMKTTKLSLPDRVIGAPVTEGCVLGDLIDSGYSSIILETAP
jgi:hypothetical protein